MSQTLETSTAEVRVDEEGILWVIYREGAKETLETAKALHESMTKLAPGTPTGLVVDIRNLGSSTREARTFWAENRGEGTVMATAVLVARGVASALGNFWLSVNRPKVPTKLFSSAADAEAWLREILEQASES